MIDVRPEVDKMGYSNNLVEGYRDGSRIQFGSALVVFVYGVPIFGFSFT